MRREAVYALLVARLGLELECPAAVNLGQQVLALWVVDTVVLPALHQLSLQLCGLVTGRDTSLRLEVATDQLLHHVSLRWVSHF